jgi:DNA modification methylase
MTMQDLSLIQGTRPSTPISDAKKPANTADQVVVCGDALEVMTTMPTGSVDVVVTSPPYDIGVPYRSHDDRMPQAAYLDWMKAIAAETARVLQDDGSAFINLGAGGRTCPRVTLSTWMDLTQVIEFCSTR